MAALEPWCQGQLKGDPEIAGIGVIVSILTTTGVAIILSWTIWFLAVWRSKTMLNSRLFLGLVKSAFVLADIQLSTSLAIIVTSIIEIRKSTEASLYHVFIARCLTQANLTGYGAALLYDTRSQTNWTLRVILLVITLIVYTCWTAMCIIEFADFPTEYGLTPKCFYNNSRIFGNYTIWMWIDIFWQYAGFLLIFLEAQGKHMHHHLARWNLAPVKLPLGAWKKISGIRKAADIPHALFFTLVYLIGAILTVLLICPPSTAPFTNTGFFLWHIYDIHTVRQANQHILVTLPIGSENINPENEWGFGQILPMFLLILPILQIVDVFTGVEKAEKENSIYFKTDDKTPTPAQSAGEPSWLGHGAAAGSSSRGSGTGTMELRPGVNRRSGAREGRGGQGSS